MPTLTEGRHPGGFLVWEAFRDYCREVVTIDTGTLEPGTVLALVCSWSISLTDAFGGDISFRIPFVGIGVLVVGTLLCTLAATAAPARSASKIDPAVALRIAD